MSQQNKSGLAFEFKTSGGAALPRKARRAKRPAPLSIRLNDRERHLLNERAGSEPISSYVKRIVLGDGTTPSRVRRITVDSESIARVLAILGQSGIGPSLTQLASYAASGSLEMDDRTLTRVLEACEDFRAVRELLMLALGKRLPAKPLPASFEEAAE